MRGFICLWTVLLLVLVPACNRDSAALEPLTLDEFASEMQNEFGTAFPAAKDLSREIVAAVATNNFAAAQAGIEMLLALDELAPDQRLIASRAQLTIMSGLRAAQARGDAEAAKALNTYRANR